MEMKRSSVTFNDLCDEIVLMIFEKLTHTDVLYSFYGANERFTRIVRDRIFVRHLAFVEQIDKELHRCFTSNGMFNRLCSEILPLIADQINRFDLESSTMKEVLQVAHYPNLSQLSLYKMTEESARLLFTNGRLSSNLFHKQIQALLLTINDDDNQMLDEISRSMYYICENLFTVFDHLVTLTFDPSSETYSTPLSFEDGPLDNFCSSNLLKLKISVEYFEDCLYLFDGRFSELNIVDLNIAFICRATSVRNTGYLLKMKCFSISSERVTNDFDQTIVPLLSRMSNLEELQLRVRVHLSYGLIDEMYLKTNLLSRLPRLNRLNVFLQSHLFLSLIQSNLSIAENIRKISHRSSKNFLISYGEYFQEANQVQYLLCSMPCRSEYFYGISNRFPGGRFNNVRRVTLYDEKPFEQEFFLHISQCFPRIEQLFVVNHKAQKRRQSDQSTNDEQNVSPIVYAHLHLLNLVDVHDHYLEQFLLDRKCQYVQDFTLYIKYQSLEYVIHHLKKDEVRINSNKVTKLCFQCDYSRSYRVQEYFPRAKIFQEWF